ncbi:unnamed protein product [Pylaiella littoralis]
MEDIRGKAASAFRNSTTARFCMMALVVLLRGTSFGYALKAGHRAEEQQGPRTTGEYDSGYDVGRRNMIKAIAELYKEEMRRQEEISMEDAVLCDNGPKEISIFCHEAPEVKIVDLAQDHRGNNECLILNINAPDVSSQLVLKCDGSTADDEFGWGEEW